MFANDLVGDGWVVLRHDVPRSGAPADVRTLIRSDFYADPQNTRAVCLIGHVPVPYSGDIIPICIRRTAERGPPMLYGEVNATWTDNSVYDTGAEDARNHNVPGDGKFDQSNIPAPVVLQVGRIDCRSPCFRSAIGIGSPAPVPFRKITLSAISCSMLPGVD